MTEDASFKIKSLSDLLSGNKEARNQVLHKQELYPFVMHLLKESNEGNELYPFLMRVLEENKELIARLAQCEQSYKQKEREAEEYYVRYGAYGYECDKLGVEIEKLKKENEALKAKIAKAAKRKSK